METPASYRFRSPSWHDLERVTALLVADQVAAAGTSTLDSAFVSSRWAQPDFDLGRDAWVIAHHRDQVVGYGMVTRDASVAGSWGIVHPDHRGRGLGSALLDRIEGRATELLDGLPDARFRHAINAGDHAAEDLLRARGLRPLRHFWHMQLDLDGSAGAKPHPEGLPDSQGLPEPKGIEIARVQAPDELAAVHAVLVAAFTHDPSHHPEPLGEWLEEHTSTPHFDPSLWLLARVAGEPVGTLTASVLNDIGWVDYLGVLERARGRGVGAALLRRAIGTFADRGIRTVRLSVDAENPTGATALYERVGMRVVWGWDLWERRPAPQSTGANSRTTAASSSTA